MQVVIRAINEFCEVVGLSPGLDARTRQPVADGCNGRGLTMDVCYQISEKMKRQDAVAALKEEH